MLGLQQQMQFADHVGRAQKCGGNILGRGCLNSYSGDLQLKVYHVVQFVVSRWANGLSHVAYGRDGPLEETSTLVFG